MCDHIPSQTNDIGDVRRREASPVSFCKRGEIGRRRLQRRNCRASALRIFTMTDSAVLHEHRLTRFRWGGPDRTALNRRLLSCPQGGKSKQTGNDQEKTHRPPREHYGPHAHSWAKSLFPNICRNAMMCKPTVFADCLFHQRTKVSAFRSEHSCSDEWPAEC